MNLGSAFQALRHDRLVGMVAAPLVWAMHFIGVYGLVGLGCQTRAAERVTAGIDWLKGALVSVTLAALALTFLIGWLAWREIRESNRTEPNVVGRARDTEHRGHFMARVTMLLAVFASIAIGLTGIPILMLPLCQR